MATRSLTVIGSGFGRTGTASLKRALEMLGFGPCHHMEEVMENPEQVAHWQALVAGKPVDWGEVFNERLLVFDVAEGWAPLCAFLNEAIPNEPFPRVNSTEEFLQFYDEGKS